MVNKNKKIGKKTNEQLAESVLITTDYLPPSSGGVERVVTELALELDQLNVDVTILSLEEGSEELENSGVTVISVPSIDLTEFLGVQARVSISFPYILTKMLYEENFDIIHSHNRFFFSTWITSLLLWFLPSTPDLITTIHLGDVRNLDGFTGKIASIIENTIGRIIFKQSKAVIGVSDAALESVSGMIQNTFSKTIYNGVDTNLFRPISEPGKIRNDTFQILFVGRLIENKGITKLIKALSVLNITSEWKLTVVGKGPLYNQCQQLVSEYGISDCVEFRGFVESVSDVMQSADIFCRPSETEGLPLTLLEAMATGLPPVVTPVGGVEEIIVSERNGLIVSPDPIEIRNAVCELIENEEYKKTISEQARKTVDDGYSWSSRAKKVLELYNKTLGDGREI